MIHVNAKEHMGDRGINMKTEPGSRTAPNSQPIEATEVPQPDLRYLVRSLLIAVLVIACLLALPSSWLVWVLMFGCPGLALIVAQWLLSRDYRQLAALCFGVVGTLVNVVYAASCIHPISFVLFTLFAGLFFTVPTVLSFGVSWATMAT